MTVYCVYNNILCVYLISVCNVYTQENQENLFSEFMQVKAGALQKGGGSGLGLWGTLLFTNHIHVSYTPQYLTYIVYNILLLYVDVVARNIMEAHGGTIAVYSAGEQQGSTFYVDIPILQEGQNYDHLSSTVSCGSSHDKSHSKRPFDAISRAGSSDLLHQQLGRMEMEFTAHNSDADEDGTLMRAKLARGLTHTSSAITTESPSESPRMDYTYSAPDDTHTTTDTRLSCSSSTSVLFSSPLTSHCAHIQPSSSLVNYTASTPSILISDDSAGVRKLTARIIKNAIPTAEIDEASDGHIALEKIKSRLSPDPLTGPFYRPYDVIIIDQEMPNMTGPQSVAAMRMLGCTGTVIGTYLYHI